MKRDRFYKTSCHGGVGSNVSFHAINGKGYVTNIDNSHIYTLAEAQEEVNKGWIRNEPEQELFLSTDHVDELSVWKVDCQLVKLSAKDARDPNDEYVIYKKGTFDGNDLGFSTELGFSYDYSKAKIYNLEDVQHLGHVQGIHGWIVVPKFHTDEIARRTFQCKNINRRKMISCAGIIGIRKPRKKSNSGKERWNCPKCGKISWQYHPYEFEGCNDINCEEWTSIYERISG